MSLSYEVTRLVKAVIKLAKAEEAQAALPENDPWTRAGEARQVRARVECIEADNEVREIESALDAALAEEIKTRTSESNDFVGEIKKAIQEAIKGNAADA